MAQNCSLDTQETDVSDTFLKLIREEAKKDVEDEVESSKAWEDRLEVALQKNDVVLVWRLIADFREKSDKKTLDNLSNDCRTIAREENAKEDNNIISITRWKMSETWNKVCHLCKYFKEWISCKSTEDNIEDTTTAQNEKERRWILILSNPLYITLEWLWEIDSNARNQPNANGTSEMEADEKEEKPNEPNAKKKSDEKADEKANETSEMKADKQRIKRKETTLSGIIEASLRDSLLLEKIAAYKYHQYSRDDYMNCARDLEKLAVDIVAQIGPSQLKPLHLIMDIEGTGCLLNEKKPDNFMPSVSLVRFGVERQRKLFVASHNCQYVLNEVINRGWWDWRDEGFVVKSIWFLFHFIFSLVMSIPYLMIKLLNEYCGASSCCSCWKLRKFFEHPYSKFINQLMSYLTFLCTIIASSFPTVYSRTSSGPSMLPLDVLCVCFACGLFIQELMELWQQGCLNYFSKWWNVIDLVMALAFLISYIVWGSAWLTYRGWRPESPSFIFSALIYASACGVAFFHLGRFFQVSSTLGPMQLCSFNMLKDVINFLAIISVLFFAFATGVAKIYSYYIQSEMELHKQDNKNGTIHYQTSHPYANHITALCNMFWWLFANVNEDQQGVNDPRFVYISIYVSILIIVFMILAVNVALNILITMMSYSFENIMKNAVTEWKFSRTQMWLEWIHKGNDLPVPVNVVHLLLLVPVFFFCKKTKIITPVKKKEKEKAKKEINRRKGNSTDESELLVNSQELRKSYEGAGERQDSDSERSDSKVQQSDDDQDKSCCSFCICLENICKKSPPSTTEERKKVMANLVVKYLMERYPEKFPLSEIIKAQSDDYGSGQRSGQT